MADVLTAEVWRAPAVRQVLKRAEAIGLTMRQIGAVVSRYRAGETLQEIANGAEVPWPTAHVLIFDLRRAGVDLPRRRGAAPTDTTVQRLPKETRALTVKRMAAAMGEPLPPGSRCLVPGCGSLLTPRATSGVCRAHNHDPRHCGCRSCVRRREDG